MDTYNLKNVINYIYQNSTTSTFSAWNPEIFFIKAGTRQARPLPQKQKYQQAKMDIVTNATEVTVTLFDAQNKTQTKRKISKHEATRSPAHHGTRELPK